MLGKPSERNTSPVISTSFFTNFTAVSPSVCATGSGIRSMVSPSIVIRVRSSIT